MSAAQDPDNPTEAGATPEHTGSHEAVEVVDPDQEQQWWQDPRMPWEGEPSRADKMCWAAFGLLGLYGLALLPLRPVLLGLNSYLLAVVTGSNIAMVDIGAKARVESQPYWWLALLASALTSIKFDWVFWWAGRLWGHRIIEVMGGRSRWAARTGRWAEGMARRFGGPAVFLTWFVPFVPGAVVAAFVGDVGMRLRRYMAIDFAAAICYRGLWMLAGYRIGEPAKDLVAQLAKYSNYLAIAAVVLVVFGVVMNNRREARARGGAGA